MKRILSAILALAMIVSVAAVCGGRADAATALPEGVLYYWGFENDADLTAVEQANRRQPIEGIAATYDIIPALRKPEIAQGLGVSGNALHLDGTYGVKLNDLERIDLDAYTISFWVYSTKAVNYAPAVQLGSNMGGDSKFTLMKFGFTPENQDNIMFSMVEMYDSEKGAVEFPGIAAIIGGEQEYGFIPAEWQMVTLVVDGEKFTATDYEEHVGTKFYVNGKLVSEVNAQHNGLGAALPDILAVDDIEGLIGINYHDELFQGYVDELYIFDKALTDEEVLALKAAATPSVIPYVPTPVVPTPVTTAPVVTKDPTAESVTEGGTAYFVARGENYNTINWYIVSADRSTRISVNNAPWNFPGLTVSGEGTTTLQLSTVPLSMNGWYIEAVFTGAGGSATTKACFIDVKKPATTPITVIPSSGFYVNDKPVQVTAAPGSVISYELYDEAGFATTGTVQSGGYITIPIVPNCRYVARLVAKVVGDENNLIVCEYNMDGFPDEPIIPSEEPTVPPEAIIGPTEPPAPAFNGGTFDNNEVIVTLEPLGDGGYYANIVVMRLCNMEGTASYHGGIMYMSMTDPAGNFLGAEYDVQTGTLNISTSTWEYLPSGTVYYGII